MNKVTYNGKDEFVSFDEVPVDALVKADNEWFGIKIKRGNDVFMYRLSDYVAILPQAPVLYKILQPGDSVTLTVEG